MKIKSLLLPTLFILFVSLLIWQGREFLVGATRTASTRLKPVPVVVQQNSQIEAQQTSLASDSTYASASDDDLRHSIITTQTKIEALEIKFGTYQADPARIGLLNAMDKMRDLQSKLDDILYDKGEKDPALPGLKKLILEQQAVIKQNTDPEMAQVETDLAAARDLKKNLLEELSKRRAEEYKREISLTNHR